MVTAEAVQEQLQRGPEEPEAVCQEEDAIETQKAKGATTGTTDLAVMATTALAVTKLGRTTSRPQTSAPETEESKEMRQQRAQESKMEKLQAEMMVGIVDEYPARTNEKDDATRQRKKICFLTNTQATILARSRPGIERFVKGMGLDSSKLLINLLPSLGGWHNIKQQVFDGSPPVLPGFSKDHFPWPEYDGTAFCGAEHTGLEAEEQLTYFIRQVILPKAVENNAIVLCAGHKGACMLTQCFLNAVSLERQKWGPHLPFSIVHYCTKWDVMYANPDPTCYWRSVMEGSKSWKLHHARMEEVYNKDGIVDKGRKMGAPYLTDLNSMATHFILVEAIDVCPDTGVFSWSTEQPSAFVNALVRHIQQRKPSITFKTGMSLWETFGADTFMIGLDTVVDAVDCGSPVVLLSGRPKVAPKTRRSTSKPMSPLAQRIFENPALASHGQNRIDYVVQVVTQYEEYCDSLMLKETPSPDNLDVMALATIANAIFAVIPPSFSKVETCGLFDAGKDGKEDETSANRSLCEAIRVANTKAYGMAKEAQGEGATSGDAQRALVRCMVSAYTDRLLFDCCRTATGKECFRFTASDVDQIKEFFAGKNLNAANFLEEPNIPEAMSKFISDYIHRKRQWVTSAEELLTTADNGTCQCHGLFVEDISYGVREVKQILERDKLPSENSLQALCLLRDAWDDYDECMLFAAKYKNVSNFLFAAQLFLQIITVMCTVLRERWVLDEDSRRLQEEPKSQAEVCMLLVRMVMGLGDLGAPGAGLAANRMRDGCPWFLESLSFPVLSLDSGTFRRLMDGEIAMSIVLGHTIFALSITSSIVIGMMSYLNPVERWRHLRCSACSIQGIIWKFRARVEDFACDPGYPMRPENRLSDALAAWRLELSAGSDIKTTSFRKPHQATVYKHGQYSKNQLMHVVREVGRKEVQGKKAAAFKKDCSSDEGAKDNPDSWELMVNDHQSPIRHEEYIQFRLLHMKQFWQKRLPSYDRWCQVIAVIAILCSSASTLLAYLDETLYVAMFTSLASAAVAWEVFKDSRGKIERYSGVIDGIKALVSKWDSFSDIERAASDNINWLVQTGEFFIAAEHTAWKSTPKVVGKKGDGTENGEGKNTSNGADGK